MSRIVLGKWSWVLAVMAIGMLAMASWGWAADLAELDSKVNMLQKEVSELKKGGTATDGAATAGATKGSFKLPGTDTSMTIGGYVKGTFVFSDKSAGAGSLGDQVLLPNSIAVGPTAGANEKNEITFHARESRLIFKTMTPSIYGPVTTYWEGDFVGVIGTEAATNSHGFRLRHAWGTIGPFGAGQYWSNIGFLQSVPETLDFGGTVGWVGAVRQVGARWTQPFTGGFWSVSLENPESVLSASVPTPDDDNWPDFIGKVNFKVGRGTFEVGGLLRSLRTDQPTVTAATTAWGGSIAGVIPTFGKDDFRVQVAYGRGIGRYIGGTGTLGDAVLVGTELETINTTSGYVAYRHFWVPSVRSSLVFSGIKASNPAGSPGTLNKQVTSVHANLIWNPVQSVELGAEYIYGSREIQSGLAGHLNRLQLSARYNFF